jgi:hypothetical protein
LCNAINNKAVTKARIKATLFQNNNGLRSMSGGRFSMCKHSRDLYRIDLDLSGFANIAKSW